VKTTYARASTSRHTSDRVPHLVPTEGVLDPGRTGAGVTVEPTTTPAVVWSWSHALLGALYAVPAAVVVFVEPSRGVALAVGGLPAAAVGLPGPRRGRIAIAVVGALMGTCMLIGSLLAQVPVVAVPAIFALCVGAAVLASRSMLGTRSCSSWPCR